MDVMRKTASGCHPTDIGRVGVARRNTRLSDADPASDGPGGHVEPFCGLRGSVGGLHTPVDGPCGSVDGPAVCALCHVRASASVLGQPGQPAGDPCGSGDGAAALAVPLAAPSAAIVEQPGGRDAGLAAPGGRLQHPRAASIVGAVAEYLAGKGAKRGRKSSTGQAARPKCLAGVATGTLQGIESQRQAAVAGGRHLAGLDGQRLDTPAASGQADGRRTGAGQRGVRPPFTPLGGRASKARNIESHASQFQTFVHTNRQELGRRNLTRDQWELLIGDRYNRQKKTKAEAGAKGGSSKGQNDTCLVTADKLAAEYGVSPATVKRAGKTAE